MPRGGKREGAGKKSEWKHSTSASETKLIRVPIVLADDILALARKLDAGEITQSDDSKEKFDKVYAVIAEYQARSIPKGSRDWTQANRMIAELLAVLEESKKKEIVPTIE